MLDADDEKRVTLSRIPRCSYTRCAAQDYRLKTWHRKTGCCGLNYLVHLSKASDMQSLFRRFGNLHLTALADTSSRREDPFTIIVMKRLCRTQFWTKAEDIRVTIGYGGCQRQTA